MVQQLGQQLSRGASEACINYTSRARPTPQAGVDMLSYLITWRGSDPALRPILLVSHVDVVPVPEASEQVCGYCVCSCD